MAEERALALFRADPPGLRTGEAIRLGVHPRILYALRDHVLPVLQRDAADRMDALFAAQG